MRGHFTSMNMTAIAAEIQTISREIVRPAAKVCWDTDNYRYFRKEIDESPLRILTMTFCIKMPRQNISAKLLNLIRASNMFALRTKSKRRGINKSTAFPNVLGTFDVSIRNNRSTMKLFKNGSLQFSGCRSFDHLFENCDVVQSLSGCNMKMDINNISLITNINEILPKFVLPGYRIACANLSSELNKLQNWAHSDFHNQTRQTNLNLWYICKSGRYYASVYPRGNIRITSKNADVAKKMLSSILECLIAMKDRATCEDVLVAKTKPAVKKMDKVQIVNASIVPNAECFLVARPIQIASRTLSQRAAKFKGSYESLCNDSDTESECDSVVDQDYDKIFDMFVRSE